MKTIFTLVILSLFSITAPRVYGSAFTNRSFAAKTNGIDKKNALSIGSDRKTGDMQISFASGKEGEAVIMILDEAGKTVLQQTSRVKNSTNIIPLKKATGLTEGSYTVRLVSNNETYTTRFMIWK